MWSLIFLNGKRTYFNSLEAKLKLLYIVFCLIFNVFMVTFLTVNIQHYRVTKLHSRLLVRKYKPFPPLLNDKVNRQLSIMFLCDSVCVFIWNRFYIYKNICACVTLNCYWFSCIYWTCECSHSWKGQTSLLLYVKPNFSCVRGCQLLQLSVLFWRINEKLGKGALHTVVNCCMLL